jgi:hypothetical protein
MAIALTGYAQPDMGDKDLNTWLASIDTKYKTHASDFRHYVLTTYKVHTDEYDYMQAEGMKTGDIYLASEVSKISNKKLTDVVASYKSNKAKGWAFIAKESGVSTGLPTFEKLKDDAYKLANGTARPKPKPKPAPAKPKAKTPATKTPAKTKQQPAKSKTAKPK